MTSPLQLRIFVIFLFLCCGIIKGWREFLLSNAKLNVVNMPTNKIMNRYGWMFLSIFCAAPIALAKENPPNPPAAATKSAASNQPAGTVKPASPSQPAGTVKPASPSQPATGTKPAASNQPPAASGSSTPNAQAPTAGASSPSKPATGTGSLFKGAPAQPAAPMSFPIGFNLRIFIDTGHDNKKAVTARFKRDWSDACSNIKKLMVNTSGRLGEGAFLQATCIARPTKLRKEAGKNDDWLMRVVYTPEKSGVEIYFVSNSRLKLEASYMVPEDGDLLFLIKKPEYLIDLIRLLHDQLPMHSIVKLMLNPTSIEVSPTRIWDSYPSQIVLYDSLAWDAGRKMWTSNVVGYAVPPTNTFATTWKVVMTNQKIDANTIILAHNGLGRGTDLRKLQEKLLKDMYDTPAEIPPFMRENATTLRFGKRLSGDKKVYGTSPQLGLTADIRKGMLGGLRLAASAMPKSTFTLDDGSQGYWASNTLAIGWSVDLFGEGRKDPIRNRIDVQPRLSLLKLSSRMLAMDDKITKYPVVVAIDQKFLGGGEIGFEQLYFTDSLVRLWLSYDQLLEHSKNDYWSVKSGIDVYWSLFAAGSVRFKLLTFGSFEYCRVTGRLSFSDGDLLDTKQQMLPMTYGMAFVGMGIVIVF